MTNGDTISGRSQFIAWWENPNGDLPYSIRSEYAIKTDEINIRQSFKDAVDAFLQNRRNPQSGSEEGSKSPFVDAIHYLKNKILNVALQPSDWEYVPGYDATVGVQTPVKLVSAGVGGGNFSVFKKSNSDKVYPLHFILGTIGTGLGPSLPININVNPRPFPSAGKIYNGLGSSVSSIASFYGAFVSITGGVADVANQTSALMFIAPLYAMPSIPFGGMDGARWTQMFLSVIPLSSAIISLDGNGIEASISVSAQVACGFVKPAK